MKLSVIIPCFNELKTIDTVVAAVRNSPYDNKEIIIVDDFSTDGTREKIRNEIERKITAKVAKLRCRIYEVGISYYGRTYEEGKKIGWKDGFRAFYCIIKYNLFR